MQDQIQELVEAIVEDFRQWSGRSKTLNGFGYDLDEHVQEFADEIRVKPGRKYIKIIKENCVWGFIVNTDTDKKFRKGDILKAAGYNAPARNQARGNILDGGYEINWTGPSYLR
jgi:hypothetical protein